MHITVTNLLVPNTKPTVIIEHRSSKLYFIVSCFYSHTQKRNLSDEYELFAELNQYWGQLPIEKQDQIWAVYRSIRSTFDNVTQRDNIIRELSIKSVELLNLHDFEDVLFWVTYRSSVNVPDSINQLVYEESVDTQGSRDQTYLRSDYVQLVAMTIVFRTMIPVWGEYIFYIRKDTGFFKEYRAFDLVNGAEILATKPFHKLKVYIERTLERKPINQNAILENIPSQDFPNWITALVVIRRICTGDIRGLNTTPNLVICIYKFIFSKMENTDVRSEDMIKSKTPVSSIGDDDKNSIIEQYKITYNLSVGDIEELRYRLRDMRAIAYSLSPHMTDEILDRSLTSAQSLMSRSLVSCQITLLQWVFKPIVPPKAFDYIGKAKIVEALGVLQAVLWARGHAYLSVFATAYPDMSNDIILVNAGGSRPHLPDDLVAEIERYYPFTKPGGKKTSGRNQNLAIQSIVALVNEMTRHTWCATADAQLLETVMPNHTSQYIEIPPNIRPLLAQLVVELGSRSWRSN